MKFGIADKDESGWPTVDFSDHYGTACFLKCSSIIGDYDDSFERPGTSCVIMGVQKVDAKVLCRDANLVGLETEKKVGWMDYPIPEQVSMHAALHLNIEQARGLVERLSEWLENGDFSNE